MVALNEGRVVVGHAHAATTSATRSLHDDWVTDSASDLQRVLFVLHGPVAAWHNRHPGFAHRFPSGNLIAH